MEKLSADALRLALVTASMEYYKKYVEGNQDFDNSEQIKEELDKLEAAGLGGIRFTRLQENLHFMFTT